MKPIFVARDPAEAALLKGLLEAGGIPAAVRDDDLWGARDDSGLSPRPPTVVILDDELEAEARGIVATYQAAPAHSQSVVETWRCPRCEEEVELQFGACWSCGADLPDGT